MFGFFKPQEQKDAELRAQFFALLKKGDFKRADDPSFDTINLHGCCVPLDDSLDKGFAADELDNMTQPAKAEDLLDLSEWSEIKRSAFFQFRRLSTNSRHAQFLFPLSYFVHKGNIDAVSFLLNRDYKVHVGFQEPLQNEKRSFLQPIYYALNQPSMIKFLLEKKADLPSDLGEFALVELNESSSASRAAVIQILYDLDANFKKNFQSLVDLRLSNTEARRMLLEGMKLQDWRPVVPETKKQDSKKTDKPVDVTPNFPQVTIKHVVDDVTVIDLYDFELRERISVTKSPRGDQQPLRESFNSLGRHHRGLKKAYAEFTQKGGNLTEEQLFSTGEITKAIYNPPASISTAAPG